MEDLKKEGLLDYRADRGRAWAATWSAKYEEASERSRRVMIGFAFSTDSSFSLENKMSQIFIK